MREGKTTEVDGYIFSIVSLDSYEHIPFNNEFVKVRAEYTALVVKPEKGKTYHIKIRETGTVGSFALIEGVIRVFLSGVFYDVGIEVHIEIMMIRFLDGEITCLGKEIN
jgi:DNA-directed RNA polymerase subunit E'/Rpb7